MRGVLAPTLPGILAKHSSHKNFGWYTLHQIGSPAAQGLGCSCLLNSAAGEKYSPPKAEKFRIAQNVRMR